MHRLSCTVRLLHSRGKINQQLVTTTDHLHKPPCTVPCTTDDEYFEIITNIHSQSSDETLQDITIKYHVYAYSTTFNFLSSLITYIVVLVRTVTCNTVINFKFTFLGWKGSWKFPPHPTRDGNLLCSKKAGLHHT